MIQQIIYSLLFREKRWFFPREARKLIQVFFLVRWFFVQRGSKKPSRAVKRAKRAGSRRLFATELDKKTNGREKITRYFPRAGEENRGGLNSWDCVFSAEAGNFSSYFFLFFSPFFFFSFHFFSLFFWVLWRRMFSGERVSFPVFAAPMMSYRQRKLMARTENIQFSLLNILRPRTEKIIWMW